MSNPKIHVDYKTSLETPIAAFVSKPGCGAYTHAHGAYVAVGTRAEPEPDPPIQTDDEWGEMSGDWKNSEETLTSAAATFAQIQHENRRGDGPRDAAEQTLRPLPGTTAGEDGWYFDREGRPSHWKHSEENGWSQE